MAPQQEGRQANRFHWKGFNDRVAAIKVNIFRDFNNPTAASSSTTATPTTPTFSYTHEALMRWQEFDVTKHFAAVLAELAPKVRSLPLILHHKDAICDILLKHLAVPNSTALRPLLEFVSPLSFSFNFPPNSPNSAPTMKQSGEPVVEGPQGRVLSSFL